MNSLTTINTNIKDYNFSENAFLPRYVNVPLSQEFDRNCKVIVKPGENVKEGQVIGVSEEGTHIHSPVPGKVIDIVPCVSPNGKQEHAVRIQFGGTFSYLGKKIKQNDLSSLSQSEIITKLIDMSVSNTFDVSRPENLGIEINSILQKKTNILVVRLFDEDIFRITDSLMTKFYFEQIIEGTKVIVKAMKAKAVLFVVDIKNDISDKIIAAKIPNSYVLKMSIKKYSTAFKRGIITSFNKTMRKTCNFVITRNDLFVDSSTIYEVYKSIICNIPEISHHVHFSGNCINSSCLLDVKIGTSAKDIISQIGGFSKSPSQVIINGLLNGVSVSSLDIPITKYVKSIAFLSKDKVIDKQIYSCVNCGYCRVACPVNISPDILYTAATNFLQLPVEHAVSAVTCIECGICNTVCPSRLPLSQTISILKNSQRHILDKNSDN